jgi:hypothetical protein
VAAEDQDLAAEDQALATEIQQVVAAEDQDLAAEDQALAPIQQVMAEDDQTVRAKSTAGININQMEGNISKVCRKKQTIIDSEDTITHSGETHQTAGDALEGETVPAEPIKDLIRDEHLGIQATKTLNSKLRTSMRPSRGRQASRSIIQSQDQQLAKLDQQENWQEITKSTAAIISKVDTLMTDIEKDVETDSSIAMMEFHSQERIMKKVGVHRLDKDADLHEQTQKDDALCHRLPRSSMTTIRQSSTTQEAVARSVEVPIINLDKLKLTKLNSGIAVLTITTNKNVVINEDPYIQMRDKEDEKMESADATMPTATIRGPNFKSGDNEMNAEAANDPLDEVDDEVATADAANDPLDEIDDEVTPTDAAATKHGMGNHWSKGIIMTCGYAKHGTFCECSRESLGLSMATTVGRNKITYIVPVRWRKSVEITQREYNKFYNDDGSNNVHRVSKEQLKQNLFKMVDEQKRPRMTDGHPFIRKLLWDQEDNHSDESTEEMILMMIETSTQRSLHQLNDPMNIPHLDKTKLNQTLEPDDENVINVVEDEPEEEPPKIHTTKKEVKQRQSDTIPSTTTVLTIHEDDYEENVFVKATNEENVFIEDTYKGDRDDKTFKGNLKIEDTHEEENVFVKATNGENVFIKNTNQGDRDAKTF